MTKWEYLEKREGNMKYGDLNRLGADGWELVGIYKQGSDGGNEVHYVFKRLLILKD